MTHKLSHIFLVTAYLLKSIVHLGFMYEALASRQYVKIDLKGSSYAIGSQIDLIWLPKLKPNLVVQ